MFERNFNVSSFNKKTKKTQRALTAHHKEPHFLNWNIQIIYYQYWLHIKLYEMIDVVLTWNTP